MIKIYANDVQSAVPQIVKAIKDAVTAAGQAALIPSDLEAQLSAAFKEAAPYINGATVVAAPVVQAAKKVETPVVQTHPAPVSSVNAKWNDRCGRWQNTVTGAFIPFKA
jgi:hypothetical protein